MGALIVNFWLAVQRFRRLEQHHSAIWKSLGQPRFGDSNLSLQWLSLLKWVWTLGFRGQNVFSELPKSLTQLSLSRAERQLG